VNAERRERFKPTRRFRSLCNHANERKAAQVMRCRLERNHHNESHTVIDIDRAVRSNRKRPRPQQRHTQPTDSVRQPDLAPQQRRGHRTRQTKHVRRPQHSRAASATQDQPKQREETQCQSEQDKTVGKFGGLSIHTIKMER
jgi:hypothetical protein